MFEIGATLREARVRKRLTLQQVEDDTKIRVKYLQAMENEEFDALPAPAYVRGFLRSYATYLGLDAGIILDEYRSRHMPRTEQGPFGGSSALRPRRRRRQSGLAFVALVAVLILALIYVLGLRGGDDEAGQPPIDPGTLSARPSASPSIPSQSASAPVEANATTVVVTAAADCYLDVRRGGPRGTPVYQSVLPAGESRTFSARKTLTMMVGGDPGDLTITLNGKTVRTSGDGSGVTYGFTGDKVTRIRP